MTMNGEIQVLSEGRHGRQNATFAAERQDWTFEKVVAASSTRFKFEKDENACGEQSKTYKVIHGSETSS